MPGPPYLSLVLACYNEEEILAESFRAIRETLDGMGRPYEIVFVDDVSRDRTREILREIVAQNPDVSLNVILHEKNRGRGATVTDGFRAARGEIAGYIDVDLEVHPRYIPPLVRAIEKGAARRRAPAPPKAPPARTTGESGLRGRLGPRGPFRPHDAGHGPLPHGARSPPARGVAADAGGPDRLGGGAARRALLQPLPARVVRAGGGRRLLPGRRVPPRPGGGHRPRRAGNAGGAGPRPHPHQRRLQGPPAPEALPRIGRARPHRQRLVRGRGRHAPARDHHRRRVLRGRGRCRHRGRGSPRAGGGRARAPGARAQLKEMDATRRVARVAPAGTLAVLLLALFWRPLLRGEVFYERDIHLIFLGQTETFVRAVLSGSWPVWDPYPVFGQPMLANPDAQVLYPPQWLNLLLSPGTYFVIFVVGHLLFSALGLHALARRLGVSAAGALTGAALWMLSGPLLSTVNVWHHFAGAAWIPWVLLAADRAMPLGRRVDMVAWGAAAAGQILAGSADMAAMTATLTLGYVALRSGREPRAVPFGRLA